jgi:hypothetical protein
MTVLFGIGDLRSKEADGSETTSIRNRRLSKCMLSKDTKGYDVVERTRQT